MDRDGGGTVECDEFEMWWYMEKYGRARMPASNDLLLRTLAQHMSSIPVSKGGVLKTCRPQPHAFSKSIGGRGIIARSEIRYQISLFEYNRLLAPCHQKVVECYVDLTGSHRLPCNTGLIVPHLIERRGAAHYGDAFYIVTSGRVVIERKDTTARTSRRVTMGQVSHVDADNIFGLQAVLDDIDFHRYSDSNELVEVSGGDTTFAECLYIQRADLRDALIEEWPEGMVKLQQYALQLQEKMEHEALICLIVETLEELQHVLPYDIPNQKSSYRGSVRPSSYRSARIDPDPAYFHLSAPNLARTERNRLKRVELDGATYEQLREECRRVGVDPKRLERYHFSKPPKREAGDQASQVSSPGTSPMDPGKGGASSASHMVSGEQGRVPQEMVALQDMALQDMAVLQSSVPVS